MKSIQVLAVAFSSLFSSTLADEESTAKSRLDNLQGVWTLTQAQAPFKSARVEISGNRISVSYEKLKQQNSPVSFSGAIYEVTKDRILFSSDDKGMVYLIRGGRLGLEAISKDYNSIGQILLERK